MGYLILVYWCTIRCQPEIHSQNKDRFNKTASEVKLTYVVCTERTFKKRPFMYNKIFKKNLLQKFAVHLFTLLLTPFAPKLVNWSRIIDQFGCKRCQMKSKDVSYIVSHYHLYFSKSVLLAQKKKSSDFQNSFTW